MSRWDAYMVGDEFVEVARFGEPTQTYVLVRDGVTQTIELAKLLYVLGRIDVDELEQLVEHALTASSGD